jgi:integrase
MQSRPILSLNEIFIPTLVRTREGAEFDPRNDLWAYRDGVTDVRCDFTKLTQLSKPLVTSIKATLLRFVENSAAQYVNNLFMALSHFSKNLTSTGSVVEEIDDISLINYRSTLLEDDSRFGTLKALLVKLISLGYRGLSPSARRYLEETTVQGNRKGEAVRTWDPVIGQLTDLELEGLQIALNHAYARNEIDQGSFLLCWLIMALGCRPIQLAALKLCDFETVTSDEGVKEYWMSLPRAKQRGATRRALKKKRKITPQIGEEISHYVRQQLEIFKDLLEDSGQAPMFSAKKTEQHSSPGFEHHTTAQGIKRSINDAFNSLGVVSERTNENINVSPIRFRRTVGTRLAAEGYASLVIAEILDHDDTQHVQVYAGSVPAIADRLDRAVAISLTPIVQAFTGRIIHDEKEATRGNDPTSRIIDLRVDQSGRAMGSCGQHSFCDFNAPIACYTCPSFEPWLDGPHEKVRDYLLERREKLLAIGDGDKRIAGINDLTIVAVQKVIMLCEAQKRSINGC